jgi:hypothetical protein
MLNEFEEVLFAEWKKKGVVKNIDREEIRALFDGRISHSHYCGDDRVDHCCHMRREIGDEAFGKMDQTRLYAGPADFAASFKHYDEEFAKRILARWMFVIDEKIRDITTFNLVWHWPCGILQKICHQMHELPCMASESEIYLRKVLPPHISINHFIHARKKCPLCGEEKNTYDFFPELA